MFIIKFQLIESAFAQFRAFCSSKTKIQFGAEKIVFIQFPHMILVRQAFSPLSFNITVLS